MAITRLGSTFVIGLAVCSAAALDKGPHFKGFFYGAMAGLSHKIH
jgi:hypothetical protein